MKIIIATVVKDEAHRYWRSCIKEWDKFADKFVILDDGSTDETREIAATNPKSDVFTLPDNKSLWGHEAPHRAALFRYAMRSGDPGDIVFWLDADMVPARDPRQIFDKASTSIFAFFLYDLWGKDSQGNLLYRDDDFWRAHNFPRVWALRIPDQLDKYEWGQKRGIHSGHIPGGWWLVDQPPSLVLPRDYSLLHYGYFTEADRTDRHQRYLSVSSIMTEKEVAHAKSITEQNPKLHRLDIVPKFTLERAS